MKYTSTQFKNDLNHPFAWPGGYPMFFVCSDGGCLCHKCAQDNVRIIADSIDNDCHDGWRVEAHTVNWEDTELMCDNCNEKIESAYGDNE
jgi:hypothetical protein